jgi:MFS family permease
MAGGWLADRWSRRGVMVFPILAASVVLVSAVLWPVPFWLLLALLGAGGALAWAGHAVNIVLGYEYVPSRPALASGLMVGGAWGVATLSFPFWGSLADAHGPNMALIGLLATTPVLAAVAALVLPHTERPGEARP